MLTFSVSVNVCTKLLKRWPLPSKLVSWKCVSTHTHKVPRIPDRMHSWLQFVTTRKLVCKSWTFEQYGQWLWAQWDYSWAVYGQKVALLELGVSRVTISWKSRRSSLPTFTHLGAKCSPDSRQPFIEGGKLPILVNAARVLSPPLSFLHLRLWSSFRPLNSKGSRRAEKVEMFPMPEAPSISRKPWLLYRQLVTHARNTCPQIVTICCSHQMAVLLHLPL